MLSLDGLVVGLSIVAGGLQVTGADVYPLEGRQGPGPASVLSPSLAPGPVSMPSSASTMATSTASSSSPSTTAASLAFNAISNMTTCTSANISWVYTGPAATIQLAVTNISVTQQDSSQTFIQDLVDTDALAESWAWPTVNVSQGWYAIQGFTSGSYISTQSASFFVSNGTNTNCLSTSPSSSMPASAASTVTASSAPSQKNNTSAIVGGVVGGIVGVAIIALLGVLWLMRRRRRPSRGGGDRRSVGRWGSLTSNSSHVNPGGSARDLTSNHYHGHTASAGEMLPPLVADKSVASTPGGSNEDVDSLRDEKLLSRNSLPPPSPFDNIVDAPLPYRGNRSSTYSLQTPSVAGCSHARASSVRTSNNGLEEQAQRLRSSMDGSLFLRTERLSMPASPGAIIRTPTSPARARDDYPPFPSPISPVARSNSGTRRTPRKPVPYYDPSELQSSSHETPTLDTHSTLTTAGESSQSGTEAFTSQTELSHKASFGSNRPVHYLIPDMPPPRRD
ncbi:hypothetical protein BV22DRAFT_512659 [Leucogyrophana mollusca]|uniref:Uncharacterized protein n=1 Tax=Leucogyrophana mollusca TaxID=85980 RepID=A0ACB8BFV8_9AGAM|nr:hypothetical protein BV22DRAFT_512659 [Leucogyrophana mollusca]